jgi:hypothetical protein
MTPKTTALSVLLAALLATVAIVPSAAAKEVFVIADPKGDDFGSGDLRYPPRDDMERGSLDIERFEADTTSKGTWFKTRFGRRIANPSGRQTYVGKENVADIARHGFYTINIDIYVDMDRVVGSGRTDTVPGRRVSIRPDSAWEKAIIVTPRPEVARAYYEMHLEEEAEKRLGKEQGRVTREDREAISEQVAAELERDFLFADQIRVRGRDLEVFVPNEFFGGPASPDWAYSVFVTGADIEQVGMPFGIDSGGFTLMVYPVGRGMRYDRFAIADDGDPAQPPVIDVLAPSIEEQRRALSDYDTRIDRLAAVPAMAPSGRPATGGPAPDTRVAARPAPAAAAKPAPGASAPQQAPSAGPAVPPPPDIYSQYLIAGPDGEPRRTVPARLKTLNQLLSDGLITEDEYQELRLKLLSEI